MNSALAADCSAFWTDTLAKDLLVFFTGRIKCPEAAADLTQETFLRFQKFVSATPPDNARALAFGIAVNLATDYQRKMKVHQRIMVDAETESGPFGATDEAGPERVAIAQQQLQLVTAALDELTAECRTAFVLHSMDGLTQEQIAKRLGISTSKVYRLLVKAMSHCQSRLNRSLAGDV